MNEFTITRASEGGWAVRRSDLMTFVFAGDRHACLKFAERQMVVADGGEEAGEDFKLGCTA